MQTSDHKTSKTKPGEATASNCRERLPANQSSFLSFILEFKTMSTSNSSDAASSRLQGLQTRVAETAARSSQRLTVTSLVMLALLLGVFFYLWFLSNTISEYTKAPILVQLVADQVEPRLQEAPAQLAESLKEQAPAIVGQGETLIMEAVPQLLKEADSVIVGFFESEFKEIEDEAYRVIYDAFEDVIAEAKKKNIDLAKEGELEKAVAQAAPALREMVQVVIEQNFEKFSEGTTGVGVYIDHIASDENLTDHEQAQKEVLISGLALLKKMELDRSRAPIQGVLDGTIPADSPLPSLNQDN
jgi:hypothetical protein